MPKAIFLDRDGVLNQAIVLNGKPYPPSSQIELTLISGIQELLEKLKNNGYKLIVVTNQPDVARGKTSKEWVEEINSYIKSRLPIDAFKVCYHDDSDGCLCRKPLPGAILEAAQEFDIDLSCSYMIGDRWKDISAGQSAGCKTIFIDYGYDEKSPDSPDYVVKNLGQIEKIILGESYEKN
jgi:D-glycero-D-manno-heptose 1,7-bisphosphate phosphatase